MDVYVIRHTAVAIAPGICYGQTDVPVGNNFVVSAAGNRFSLALKDDGSLVGWGLNDYGQTNVPTGNNFVSIAGGEWHCLALTPEPTTLSLLALGGLVAIRRRRN